MAKKTYVGINNVAKQVKKMYVGVNGVAKKVKKAYIGVNGIAQQFYSAEPVWVLKTGSFIPAFSSGLTKDGFTISYDAPVKEESTIATEIYKTFDNDRDTYCECVPGTDYTKGNDYSIYLDFGKIVKPVEIEIYSERGDTTAYSIAMSEDGVTYDTVHSLTTGGTFTSIDKTVTITPNPYRYMRFTMTPKNNSTKNIYLNHIQITEWYEEA